MKLRGALAVCAWLGATVAPAQSVPDVVRGYRTEHAARILADYAALLEVPNVAGDTLNIERNAELIRAALARRGVATELWRQDDASPIVYGRLDVEGAGRTLGFYVHYDGQPVDRSQWTHPPWTPTLYTRSMEDGGQPRPWPLPGQNVDPEWRVYARSAGDDKAPLLAIFTALDALDEAGVAPTSNLRFLFEGEEEAGSPNLRGYLEEHRDSLAADVWLICDGPVHQSRAPQLVFGVRGVTALDITVYGATRYLHSGHYGNWAPNPAMALAALLASMKNAEDRVVVADFYADTAPVGAAERAAIAALPDYDAALRAELGLSRTEAADAALAERLLIPSLNVRGFVSGAVGDAARNVIPDRAEASLDIRLASGDRPETMLDRVEAHIRAQGYHIVRTEPDLATRLKYPKLARVLRSAGYPAVRTSMDQPIVRELIRATETVAGRTPILLPTMGGSLPLYLFGELLATEIVIVPIANHDNNQHAPDENLRLANLWYGTDLMGALFTMSAGAGPAGAARTECVWEVGIGSMEWCAVVSAAGER